MLTTVCSALSGCGGNENNKKTKKEYVRTLTDASVYEMNYERPDTFGKVELHYPRIYSQIKEELAQKTDGSELSKTMTYNQYNGDDGYFFSVQADRGMSMEYVESEYIGPVEKDRVTTEEYGGVSFRRAFFEESGNYVAWCVREKTFYLIKSGSKEIIDNLLSSLTFAEASKPEVIDTAMYSMQYTVPEGREKISYELRDVIDMGVTYKSVSWSGGLYTGITVEPDMKLEYRLNTFSQYIDVTVNGQNFKCCVPAGSARQKEYITQYGDDVYRIDFVYGSEEDDKAFLDTVKFS